MTPRFCGQTSTKSGPALFRVPRSSASPPTPSTYIRARLVPTLRKTMQFLSPSGPHRTARSIGSPKLAWVKMRLTVGKTWVQPAPPGRPKYSYGRQTEGRRFSHAPAPLDRTVVLDAGCGTGSYSDALLGYVGRLKAAALHPAGAREPAGGAGAR